MSAMSIQKTYTLLMQSSALGKHCAAGPLIPACRTTPRGSSKLLGKMKKQIQNAIPAAKLLE